MLFRKWIKKRCVLCRNFISIYLSGSRADSVSHSFASLTRERYFQHSKIKFVSPRVHAISSISTLTGFPIVIENWSAWACALSSRWCKQTKLITSTIVIITLFSNWKISLIMIMALWFAMVILTISKYKEILDLKFWVFG